MARKPKAAPEADPDATLAIVETLIERGQLALAISTLLPALQQRAESGDRACALAVRILQMTPIAEAAMPRPPDALAATLERLVQLVSSQQEQIAALHALVEDGL
jgi:hypothetical protein